jgi:hypothetical protein
LKGCEACEEKFTLDIGEKDKLQSLIGIPSYIAYMDAIES